VSSEPSDWIQEVGAEQFERAVIERSRERPVVVDFWAPWCAPCRILGPLLEKLIAERKGEIILAKVNSDHAPELASHYGVQAIPAVKAFRDGKVVLEFVGVYPETALRGFLDQFCPSESDRLARQATFLEATDSAEAERLYRAPWIWTGTTNSPGRGWLVS
jgi:putative thioredoxin